ncbi:MAG TPA: hypothetical protein VFU21_13495, partial [Kofleriaceae bacterium]|nr:hypothetical protein [Kofleriaceae bacterium]
MRRAAVFAVLAVVARLGTAHAGADTLLANADRSVRAALLDGGGADARAALDAIISHGAIDRALIERALANPLFAPHARATLVALATVDTVPGAKRTLERVVAANDDSNVIGAAFEIQAAALLGRAKVAGIGVEVDGHEVDLLLHDGTRVEVKHQQDDAEPHLSSRIVRKATKQLRLRGAHGAPVMLIANNPLSPRALERFRAAVGPASSVLIVENGQLVEQLARAPISAARRVRIQTVGRVSRTSS